VLGHNSRLENCLWDDKSTTDKRESMYDIPALSLKKALDGVAKA
jgi:hypothetical protein